MIASRAALTKFLRTNNQSGASTRASLSCFPRNWFSTRNVEVEHGRGEWKTYGDLSNYQQGKHQIKTFNKISPVGLSRFPRDGYDVRTGDDEAANAHSILLRSHKLQEEDVPNTVRAIARCVDKESDILKFNNKSLVLLVRSICAYKSHKPYRYIFALFLFHRPIRRCYNADAVLVRITYLLLV